MCSVLNLSTSMSAYSDDVYGHRLRYDYYATAPPASHASTASSTAYTTTYSMQRPLLHSYPTQYDPHHQYEAYPQMQYYTAAMQAPLPFRVHAPPPPPVTSTSTPFSDAQALPLVESDFDDMRMLQEMLLTPHPRDEEVRASANHLMMDLLTRSTSLPTTKPSQSSTPHSEVSSCDSHTATRSNPRSPRASLTRTSKDRKVAMTRICRVPDCTKGIRSRGLCKAHGGGRRCQTPGCTISDQGGGHCIAHGGGKRCTIGGCEKSAQYKGLCKVHGGSRQCRATDCQKNGQIKGLCRLHYTLSAHEDGEDA